MADGGGGSSLSFMRETEEDEGGRGGGDEPERRRRHDERRPSTASAAGDRDDDVDPRLDFLSPSFDAQLALSTAGLAPPDHRAPILDNVSACRRLLPPGAEGAFDGVRPPPRRRRDEQAPPPELARPSRPRRVPAISAIAEAAAGAEGPLSLLKKAHDERSRVRVVTRHARGVRGAASGQLCGFDVFMNLVLRDVVEEYTVRVPVVRERPPRAGEGRQERGEAASREARGAGGGERGSSEDDADRVQRQIPRDHQQRPPRRLRRGYRLEERKRTLRLVFLRGDSVVLVSNEKSDRKEM